jgi:hypothetical protein
VLTVTPSITTLLPDGSFDDCGASTDALQLEMSSNIITRVIIFILE